MCREDAIKPLLRWLVDHLVLTGLVLPSAQLSLWQGPFGSAPMRSFALREAKPGVEALKTLCSVWYVGT